MPLLRRLLLRGARGLLFGYAALLVAFPAGDRLQQSPVEYASSGFAFDLLAFEFGNFFDKWAYRVLALAPWVDDSASARDAALEQYHDLARRFRENNAALASATAQGSPTLIEEAQSARAQLEAERNAIRNLVEEHLEAELSKTLHARGFGGGDFLWPPVDFRIDDTPSVLVTSERDVIRRREGRLLDSYLTDESKLAIEEQLLHESDLSAVVLRTGGLAAFPNIVPSHYDLLPLLEVSAHEWLHAYLLFQPLGRAYWDNGDMTSLNETLAQLFGNEVGRLTYNRITGANVDPLEPPPGVEDDDAASADDAAVPEDPNRFDFREFMFETRQRSDELLADGMIDDAEAYMEDRRLELVGRGYNIRKLNQAYFAFHGAYALGSASTSPLGRQLWALRKQSDGIGELVELLQPIADYEGFLALLDTRGIAR